MDTTAIGIDLGATKIAAALVKQTGEVLAARSLPTRADEGVSPVVDRIAELANELGREAERHSLPLLGLGIGSPGLVNAGIGIVHNAVNLGWKDVYLVDEVKSRLERTIPVWVQKDGNASAIGENIFGS